MGMVHERPIARLDTLTAEPDIREEQDTAA
jgi:hypothetical protein